MQFRHGHARPEQPETPAPDAFEIHKARVRDELEIAFIREGVGGYPLLLIHGWPETKRIWWRNILPLAEAGFEVIVPDLRGYGDSDLSQTDQYDIVEYSRDLHALVHDLLGHERCAVAAGDVGGVVSLDMALRFGKFVERLCFFNSVPPFLGEVYEKAGLDPNAMLRDATGDYRIWQGERPDELIKKLDTEQRRRDWVASMYGPRLWAVPDAFSDADVDFMTEPYAPAEKMLASWAPYQLAAGRRAASELPRLMERVETLTLVLWGPEDHVLSDDFVSRCELAFPNRIGPLVVPCAGHFLQWERADIFNATLSGCFRDLVLGR
ncbi:MAG: alpha/beta hydrolase [Deltaproteobacteria bacterium]|nr:alpha/beta hydrolase [Myxococcales bacterium]TDJ10449.1 MAG: alpha/beta hydrolase [Deltaproteobacteria bacterium]TDJ18807.1 MAG: alpha/beta hydrolase [Deltaproteobacteria bacterium]